MRHAQLLSKSLLLAGSLVWATAWSADLSRASTTGAESGSDPVSQAQGPNGQLEAQPADGHRLTPSERAKLREQVRLEWLQRRPAAGADATAGLRVSEGAGREGSR